MAANWPRADGDKARYEIAMPNPVKTRLSGRSSTTPLMSERTPIDLLAVSAISALGTLALIYSGWALVDNWMRRVGRVV